VFPALHRGGHVHSVAEHVNAAVPPGPEGADELHDDPARPFHPIDGNPGPAVEQPEQVHGVRFPFGDAAESLDVDGDPRVVFH